MNESTPAKRIQALRARLRDANTRYYIEQSPTMSDLDYDSSMRELIELENNHPELQSPDSPSQTVGSAPQASFASVVHPTPMTSLDNAFSEEEIHSFEARAQRILASDAPLSYLAEPKVDGLSLNLYYRYGALEWAATRGNGQEGEIVTENVLLIPGIPHLLQGQGIPETLEVRGEVYMPKSTFKQLNQDRVRQEEMAFRNPRNAASGALRQKDPKLVAERGLHIFCYALSTPTPLAQLELNTQEDVLVWLQEGGFCVNPLREVLTSPQAVEALMQTWIKAREGWDFEADGIVLKLNTLALHDELGANSRAPRWAVAYKFPAEEATSVLKTITWQVGRTGKLTPVANLEPRMIDGSQVSRATLHNPAFIASLDLRLDDQVLLHKSGGIIPEILKVISSERPDDAQPYVPPTHCPECNTPVVSDGPNLFCHNPACPAQQLERIKHYASRKALDIEGLASKTVDKLVEAGLIASIPDLYDLSTEQVLKLEGFGKVSSQNLITGIEKSKTAPFEKFLFGLGLPQVGSSTARVLATAYPTVKALRQADSETLQQLHDIGQTTADAIYQTLHTPSMQAMLDALIAKGVNPSPPEATSSDTLRGVTVVLTGTLNRPRGEIKKDLELLGARVSSSLSKKTDYLIAGDNAGSKLDKAKELSISILDEQGLAHLLASDTASEDGA